MFTMRNVKTFLFIDEQLKQNTTDRLLEVDGNKTGKYITTMHKHTYIVQFKSSNEEEEKMSTYRITLQ